MLQPSPVASAELTLRNCLRQLTAWVRSQFHAR